MNVRRFWRLAVLVAALLDLCFGSAEAHMIRLGDRREISVVADCSWAHAADEDAPPEPWEKWTGSLGVVADLGEDGSATSTSFQISEYIENQGISASGGTGGSWYQTPGSYSATSLTYFLFYTETCSRYSFDAWLDQGDGFGEGHVILRSPFTTTAYETCESGEVHHTGLLAPGTYYVEGLSRISGQTAESMSGPVYSLLWTCIPCDSTRIHYQPRDTVVVCDNAAVFSLTPTGFAANPTYQWRMNGGLLPENGHYTGTSTATLTIHNACFADEGYYDCLVTDGGWVEASRLARLRTVADITGVEPAPEQPAPALSVSVVGANPFSGATSFRYVAAAPLRATMAIYNIAGAKIRTLSDAVVSGAGTVTWDGTTASGDRAPAGVYFLRVEAGSIRESRKVVLLR